MQKGPDRGGVRIAIVNEMIVSAAVSRQTQKPKLAAIVRDGLTGVTDCTCVDIGSLSDLTRARRHSIPMPDEGTVIKAGSPLDLV